MAEIDPYSGMLVGCDSCAHLRENRESCSAFPKGIPWPIRSGTFDHREPFEGDEGVRWESIALEGDG